LDVIVQVYSCGANLQGIINSSIRSTTRDSGCHAFHHTVYTGQKKMVS
jgi:hypothetical protein